MDFINDDKLLKQFQFLTEIDKLKAVLRRTLTCTGERLENTAEHSWHLAMMVIVCAEHAKEPIDTLRAMKMALIHDIVEIDAGDTFVYDTQARIDKEAEETKAAERIFGLLPEEQALEYRKLWLEYERQDCTESRYVKAIDRIQPMISNYLNEGYSWRKHNVSAEAVQSLVDSWKEGTPKIGDLANSLIEKAKEQKYLR